MKKILGLTIAAIMVIAMVGGGTWSYFSDTETSTNNSLTAGTLDLNINGGNTAVTTFSATGKAPGDSGSGNVTLSNVGNLTGKLSITFSSDNNTGGTAGEFGDGVGNLGGVAQMAVYIDTDQSGTWNGGDIGLKSDNTTYNYPTALNYATIDSYSAKSWSTILNMAASAANRFVILWQIPTSAGNNIQGDSVNFDITFTLDKSE